MRRPSNDSQEYGRHSPVRTCAASSSLSDVSASTSPTPSKRTISGGAAADSKTAATPEPSGYGVTRGWNRAPTSASPVHSDEKEPSSVICPYIDSAPRQPAYQSVSSFAKSIHVTSSSGAIGPMP